MIATINYKNTMGLFYDKTNINYDDLDEFEAECFTIAQDALDCDTGFKLLEIDLHDDVDYRGFEITQQGAGVLESTYN